MNTKYTKSVVVGGIFLIGLGVLIFMGSWRLGIIPSPIPSPSIVDTKESNGILTHLATQAPYSEKVRFTLTPKRLMES